MRLNKKQFRNVVTEEVTKLLGEMLLNEDAEHKGQDNFRKAFKAQGLSDEQVKETYKSFLNDMPHIRAPYYTNSNGIKKGYYKWAPGVVRMFFNSDCKEVPFL